jgi:hypothetical protein
MKRSTNSARPRRSTVRRDEARCDRARHQIAVRIGRVADADVAIGVEHAAVVENTVRQHQLFDHG